MEPWQQLQDLLIRVVQKMVHEWQLHEFITEIKEGRGWSYPLLKQVLHEGEGAPAGEIAQENVPECAREVREQCWVKGFKCQGKHSYVLENVPGANLKTKVKVYLARAFWELVQDRPEPGVIPVKAAKVTGSIKEESQEIAACENSSCWELVGSSSKDWPHRKSVVNWATSLVQGKLSREVQGCLAAVRRVDAEERFRRLGTDSCLVGVMVADLADQEGRTLRVVSVSGNMRGDRGRWEAQTDSGPGQYHMEQFNMDRLRCFAKGAIQNLVSVEVCMLGFKTSNIVKENKMCSGCEGTRDTELKADLTGVDVNVNVYFLG